MMMTTEYVRLPSKTLQTKMQESRQERQGAKRRRTAKSSATLVGSELLSTGFTNRLFTMAEPPGEAEFPTLRLANGQGPV